MQCYEVKAEKKLGGDPSQNDGMESGDGGGNSISPMTNGIADGTTDYDPKADYKKPETVNSGWTFSL